jgi:hypothetical protein
VTLHALMHAGEIGWPRLLNGINVDYLTLRYHDTATRLGESVRRVADFELAGEPDVVASLSRS